MTERSYSGSSRAETEGPEQEPTEVGDQDPANRDPRPDGPMAQSGGADETSDAFGAGPDAAHGQREGQADPSTEG